MFSKVSPSLTIAVFATEGPITMELSDSVFRGRESLGKVAMLVRTFAQLGGQQLQLNTINAETLWDAKRHPERHRNLIVRVWGWSGYFCELEESYQDHILARHAYECDLGSAATPQTTVTFKP